MYSDVHDETVAKSKYIPWKQAALFLPDLKATKKWVRFTTRSTVQ
jgi:hypothetical protein